MGLMDKKYIEMNLLVDRYVQGALSGPELDAFEERLVWDQALLDDVELAQVLRAGLVAARDTSYSAATGRVGLFRRLTALLAVPGFAAAASFTFAVAITSWVFLGPLSTVPVDGGAGSGQIELVSLTVTRNASLPRVPVVYDVRTVLLVDVPDTYDVYRITLRPGTADASPLLILDNLRPTQLEALAIELPRDLTVDRKYVLSVEGALEQQTGLRDYEFFTDIPFETFQGD